jgi:hypothetical protein
MPQLWDPRHPKKGAKKIPSLHEATMKSPHSRSVPAQHSTPCPQNRDRGEPRGSSPPTPPDVLRSYPAVPSSFELPILCLRETARARFSDPRSVVKARVQVASVRLRLLARCSFGYASAASAWRGFYSPLYVAPRLLIFLSLTPCTRWFGPSPPNGLWPTRRVLRPRLTSALPSHAVANAVVPCGQLGRSPTVSCSHLIRRSPDLPSRHTDENGCPSQLPGCPIAPASYPISVRRVRIPARV